MNRQAPISLFTYASVARSLVLLGAILTVLSCSRDPLLPPVASSLQSAAIRDLTTQFIADSQKVRLTWSVPDGNPVGYEIFSTNLHDRFGNPDTTAMVSKGVLSVASIPLNAQPSFLDQIGLSNGTYYYAVKAIATDAETGKLVWGVLSNIDSCVVGSSIKLLINDGDIFIVVDTCKLELIDPFKKIRSVRFTDSLVPEFKVKIRNPDTTQKKDTLIDSLVPLKYVFPATNPRNAEIDYALAGNVSSYSRQWVLPQGNGAKAVAARIVLDDGTIDTVADDIMIKPYRISVKLRNETDPLLGRSMIVNPFAAAINNIDQCNIYLPNIDYSVFIYNDTTFAKDFDVWLVMADSSSATNLVTTSNGETFPAAWLETGVVHDTLVGLGPLHNDMKAYHYSFKPGTSEGNRNLSTIKRTSKQLTGFISEQAALSVPGSYWGKSDSTLNMNPFSALEYLKRMDISMLRSNGRKEIAIVVRLKGRFFNDVRTYISTPNVNLDSKFVTYYCFAPPNVFRSHWQYSVPYEGSGISNVFSINTNTTGSTVGSDAGLIQSWGGAQVIGVELLFAEMPDSISRIWSEDVRKTVTYKDLLALRHRIVPMTIPPGTIPGVELNNIDVSGWPSGHYYVAMITEDEFHNKGIAPAFISGGSAWTNPFVNPMHYVIYTRQ